MELSNDLKGAARNSGLATSTTYCESLRALLVMLSPIAPHLAAELWSQLEDVPSEQFVPEVRPQKDNAKDRNKQDGTREGSSRRVLSCGAVDSLGSLPANAHKAEVHTQSWPKPLQFAEVEDASVQLAVQIGGRMRGHVTLPAASACDADEVRVTATGIVPLHYHRYS